MFSQIELNYPMFMFMLALIILFAALSFEISVILSVAYGTIAVSLTIVFLFDVIQKRIKSNKEIVEEKFLRMQREAEKSLETIIKIRITAKQETLKSIEQDFEYENKELQARVNFLSKVTPILAISIALLFLNSFNVNSKDLESNLLYGIFRGSPGLVAVVALIISYI